MTRAPAGDIADVCVIGAGSGGLVVAAITARLGLDTVLIERGQMGGECLNTGCVPSKALLAAAAVAESARNAHAFGVRVGAPEIDFSATMAHVHQVIGQIAPNDSQERFEGMGVRVIRAEAKFVGRDEIEVEGKRMRAKRFFIATGSHPAIPPIPGLDQVPYFTNENLWANRVAPSHLIIIGGGAIGLEMAQAHRRLGADVTVLEAARIMPRDDQELVAVVRGQLIKEGIKILEGAAIEKIDRAGKGIAVTVKGQARPLEGSHLLVAAGRRPTVAGLDLEKAGVEVSRAGIVTDLRLRTANPRIYAVGDVAGRRQFTHAAADHAGTAIRHAIFKLPAKVDDAKIPWCTYTDPELAQAGLTEEEARAKFGEVEIQRFPFHDNDRALTERRGIGMVKLILGRRGRILGVGIVGPHAGELIHPWCLTMSLGKRIGAWTRPVLPYPTLGEAAKRAALNHFAAALNNPALRALARLVVRHL